jgi:hypothetical protein
MTLRGDQRRRLQTTLESYRLLLGALAHVDDAEAEMLRTMVEIAEDERALRALKDLAEDPNAPCRAGLTPDEFLRCHGIRLNPAVSISVEETGSIHLSIGGEPTYDVSLDRDCTFVIRLRENSQP